MRQHTTLPPEVMVHNGFLYKRLGKPDFIAEARRRLNNYEALCSNNRACEHTLFDEYEEELMELIESYYTEEGDG